MSVKPLLVNIGILCAVGVVQTLKDVQDRNGGFGGFNNPQPPPSPSA